MVVYVPDKTGRFARRPHYEPKELDRECEGMVGTFLKEKYGKAEFPISTEDLTVIIEREVESLDQYADLSEFGPKVEGITYFQPGRRPRVAISQSLSLDDNPVEGQWIRSDVPAGHDEVPVHVAVGGAPNILLRVGLEGNKGGVTIFFCDHEDHWVTEEPTEEPSAKQSASR